MTPWEPEDRKISLEEQLGIWLTEENSPPLPKEPPYRAKWTGWAQWSALALILAAGVSGFLSLADPLLCAGVVLVALGAGWIAHEAEGW